MESRKNKDQMVCKIEIKIVEKHKHVFEFNVTHNGKVLESKLFADWNAIQKDIELEQNYLNVDWNLYPNLGGDGE